MSSFRSPRPLWLAYSNTFSPARFNTNTRYVYAIDAICMMLIAQIDDIPASFLTTHRRSRQAMFQANSTDGTAFISPKTARMPVDGDVPVPIMSSLSSSILNTPEPARSLYGPFGLTTPSPRSSIAIVQKLRQRGSLTDPARPRRRHISGPVMVRHYMRLIEQFLY